MDMDGPRSASSLSIWEYNSSVLVDSLGREWTTGSGSRTVSEFGTTRKSAQADSDT